jgi:hypothetical protein
MRWNIYTVSQEITQGESPVKRGTNVLEIHFKLIQWSVGYQLSVLKDMFPNGVNALSLFTGIGGGEVALHRLGIHIKTFF